uniref:Uncharacterized protein n=1 Tax=Trypanosoma brucei TaxID=5691 RepID=Q581P8_9TRYP|nr:hypothetical protein, unlikely [Trypanosoma brucei]
MGEEGFICTVGEQNDAINKRRVNESFEVCVCVCVRVYIVERKSEEEFEHGQPIRPPTVI